MSHGDKVTAIPSDFVTVATPKAARLPLWLTKKNASMAYVPPGSDSHPPGYAHAGAFCADICQCEALWTPAKIIDDAVAASVSR